MLAVAGRIADGVIIQLADPEIVEWIVGQVRAAAEEAGRDPAEIEVVACAPAHVSDDMADACEQVRWFPAMVSNHVFDLLSKHDKATLPAALTDYVERMQREHYDYHEHSRVGAEHGQQVSDETCERFCVLGTPEQHVEKLRRLEAAGVDQWNIYLMTSGQEETLEPTARRSSRSSQLVREVHAPRRIGRSASHCTLPVHTLWRATAGIVWGANDWHLRL